MAMPRGTTPQLWVNGKPLSAVAKWGDLHLIDKWPYGCFEATWNVILKPYQRPPDIAAGALVEARIGSGVRWAGELGEPNWETGQMLAYGAGREGEQMLCLNNSTGETSSTPDFVIDQAIPRGLGWIRRASLSNVPFAQTEATANLNYVTALLDAWSVSAGKRWAVNGQREVFAAADPTTPSLYIRPGAGVLGQSAANQVGRIFGRYLSLTGAWTSPGSVGSGTPEVGVSLGNLGPIDSTKALAVITAIRDQAQATPGWSNGINVTPEMVTTPGGQRYGLEQLNASRVLMARLLGLRDVRGASASTDIVIASTDWDVSGGSVAVAPVALDDQTLAGIVQAAGGELL